MRRLTLLLLVSSIALASVTASAQAAIVTVGSPMTGNYTSGTIGLSYAVFNSKVPGNTLSPVTGAVVGWNLQGAAGGPFTLRVIQPINTTEYIGGGHSAPVTPISTAFQHWSTDVPITAGETVAFDHANSSDDIGFGTPLVSGAKLNFFSSPLAEGGTGTAMSTTAVEVAFNAEVQPTPVVTALGTTSGPMGGGTSVLIAGTDLENTTRVTFGGTPASFGGTTEGSVVATAPPSASAGSVPVTVTTLAGSSTAAQGFSYEASPAPSTGTGQSPPPTTTGTPPKKPVACTVPKLIGKKLGAATTTLKAAHCKLGKVTKRKGPKDQVGKIVKQASRAGSSLAGGTAVKVTVGEAQ